MTQEFRIFSDKQEIVVSENTGTVRIKVITDITDYLKFENREVKKITDSIELSKKASVQLLLALQKLNF